jgi:hypothetical protein
MRVEAGVQAIGDDVIVRDIGRRSGGRPTDQGARGAAFRILPEEAFEHDSPEERSAVVKQRADRLVVGVAALVRLRRIAPHHVTHGMHGQVAAALLGAAAQDRHGVRTDSAGNA